MNLPKDIYQEIFSLLTEQDILLCSRVCKDWKNHEHIQKIRNHIITYGYSPKTSDCEYKEIGNIKGFEFDDDDGFVKHIGNSSVFRSGRYRLNGKNQSEIFDLRSDFISKGCILSSSIITVSSFTMVKYNIDVEILTAFIVKQGFESHFRHSGFNFSYNGENNVFGHIDITKHGNKFSMVIRFELSRYYKYKKLIMDEIERIKQPKCN